MMCHALKIARPKGPLIASEHKYQLTWHLIAEFSQNSEVLTNKTVSSNRENVGIQYYLIAFESNHASLPGVLPHYSLSQSSRVLQDIRSWGITNLTRLKDQSKKKLFYRTTHTEGTRYPTDRLIAGLFKLQCHDGPVGAWLKWLGALNRDLTLQTNVASPENSSNLAPNHNLTLQTKASMRSLVEYFGIKDRMAVIVQ